MEVFTKLKLNEMRRWIEDRKPIEAAIISAVANVPTIFTDWLQLHSKKIIFLNSKTLLPIKNSYQTPETLGSDRIAGAVGAWKHFKKGPVLSIDVGTCITFDLVNEESAYCGGAISPGLQMRFKALYDNTDGLPLIKMSGETPLIGTSTADSIKSGVVNGIVAEIDGMIEKYQAVFPDIQCIITGGDGDFFAKRLKNPIFASPNLVLVGLNEILDYNL